MIEPKTYFEQVPLEIVKKIIEEQIKQEEIAELASKPKGPEPLTEKVASDSLEMKMR